MRITIALAFLAAFGVLASAGLAAPIQDSSLIMWLDGRDIDGDGVAAGAGENYIVGGVARWVDKSPTGLRSATQASASLQPTLAPNALNGSPVLMFDADRLNFAAVDWINTSAFVVARNDNATTGQLVSHSSVNRQFRFLGSSQVQLTGAPDSLGAPAFAGTTSEFNFIASEVSGTAARVGMQGNFSSPTSHNVASFQLNQLGVRGDSSEQLVGAMAEVIVYNRVLNAAERIITENYLNSKYDLDNGGLNPIANDRYSGDLAANGDYDFGVFGIGRVGAASLESGSSDGLHFSAPGGLNDGAFLMAGHKTDLNSIVTDDLPEDFTGRWERVWYADSTNVDPGLALELQFDFSEAGLTLPVDLQRYHLLYNATNSFESGEAPFQVLAQGSLDGDRVIFNVLASELANGYYTLGFQPPIIPEPATFMLTGLGFAAMMLGRRRRVRRGQPVGQVL